MNSSFKTENNKKNTSTNTSIMTNISTIISTSKNTCESTSISTCISIWTSKSARYTNNHHRFFTNFPRRLEMSTWILVFTPEVTFFPWPEVINKTVVLYPDHVLHSGPVGAVRIGEHHAFAVDATSKERYSTAVSDHALLSVVGSVQSPPFEFKYFITTRVQ